VVGCSLLRSGDEHSGHDDDLAVRGARDRNVVGGGAVPGTVASGASTNWSPVSHVQIELDNRLCSVI
jgi:hypothetical protein